MGEGDEQPVKETALAKASKGAQGAAPGMRGREQFWNRRVLNGTLPGTPEVREQGMEPRVLAFTG